MSRYFRGGLSGADRNQLLEAVLANQDLYNAFAEKQILTELLEHPGFRTGVERAVRPHSGAVRRMGSLFISLNLGWRLAIGAAVAVLVLAPIVLLERSQPSPETARQGKARPAAVPVVALLLEPGDRGLIRSNTLTLPAVPSTVKLEIEVGDAPFLTYSATLEIPGQGAIRTFAGLRPRAGAGGSKRLAIEVPSGLLRPGDYTVTIFGGDAREPAGGYAFSVRY